MEEIKTIKVGKLIRAKGVLIPYFKAKLSPKLSYKLMKFINQIETEERFFNEKLKEIINLYGEKDDKGNLIPLDGGIKIKDDEREECNNALEELDSVEVEMPTVDFTLEELNEIKLSIEDMVALSDFIKDE